MSSFVGAQLKVRCEGSLIEVHMGEELLTSARMPSTYSPHVATEFLDLVQYQLRFLLEEMVHKAWDAAHPKHPRFGAMPSVPTVSFPTAQEMERLREGIKELRDKIGEGSDKPYCESPLDDPIGGFFRAIELLGKVLKRVTEDTVKDKG